MFNMKSRFEQKADILELKCDCLMSGNINSEVAIVSEAPGRREVELKIPMVGGSGSKLWETLRKFDKTKKYLRKDVYITNVIKKQVAMTEEAKKKNPINPNELSHWESLLFWELGQLPNLKYILILGNIALKAIIGEKGIMKWRGSVLDTEIKGKTVKCIISVNPAMLFREPKWEVMFTSDINKLFMVLEGKYKDYIIDYHINPNYNEAIKWIHRMANQGLPVAIDIECRGTETACIGLANDIHEGMCINFIKDNPLTEGDNEFIHQYTLNEEKNIRWYIAKLLSNPKVKLVAQNGAFDSYWMGYKDRMPLPKIWFDTLLAHHTLYPRLLHNLGFLCTQYTTHPYYKDDGITWKENHDFNKFWRYNIKDVCITLACQKVLLKELEEQKMNDFFFSHVMRLQPHLIDMTVRGVKIDTELKQIINKDLSAEIDTIIDTFHDKVFKITREENYKPNLNSPKQISNLLFNKIGISGFGKSTNVETRERIINSPSIPHFGCDCEDEDIKSMLEIQNIYAKKSKFLSTYVKARIDEDGRGRSEYKQFGTKEAPGRLSSCGVMWGSGMNLQNQPQQAYSMFVVDSGYMISYFDLKQAEAVIVAHIWQVKELLKTFKAGSDIDVHRRNASLIFKTPYKEIPSFDRHINGQVTKRFLGKKCVHGLNYRMSIEALAKECNISIPQATQAYFGYHNIFPEIKEGWNETINRIKKDKVIFTPLGRRMIFMEQITDDTLDSMIAFVPQSTIGDFVSSVIYKCEEDKEWPIKQAKIWMNIHDALIAIHTPDVKDEVQGIMKKYGEEPIPIRGDMVSIGTDFKESYPDEKGIHRWSTLKEITI